MIRVQAQLTDEQARQLRRLSARRGVSVAALLREGADRVLADEADPASDGWQRAWHAIRTARGSGRGDVSDQHDEHLADAFGG